MGLKYSSFAIRGIDVSQYQETIDWLKVKCDFAAIRVGYGWLDSKFRANWKGAKGRVRRIPYGYLNYYSHRATGNQFSGMTDVAFGQKQSDIYHAELKNDQDGIYFADVESARITIAPPIGLVWSRVQSILKAHLIRMDELNGKFNGIYCSLDLLKKFDDWFKDRPLWVAWYNEKQTLASVLAAVRAAGWRGPVVIWQYSSKGDMDGDGVGDGRSFGIVYQELDLDAMFGAAAWKVVFNETIPDPVVEEPIIDFPEEPETGEYESYRVVIPVLNLRNQPVVSDATMIGKLFITTDKPVRISQTFISGKYLWGRLFGQGWWCCLQEGDQVYAEKV